MRLEISTAGEAEELELLDGVLTVGGSEDDSIQLAGLEPALLELRIEGERLTLVARQVVEVAGVLLPTGVARLVIPGEDIQLPGDIVLRQRTGEVSSEEREASATFAVVRALLEHDFRAEKTRAASLTCLTGLDCGRVFPLGEAAVELGRSLEVDIRIRDRSASRRHARIERDGGAFAIVELGSPNGVFVNGARLASRQVLCDGDVLELGRTLLRFCAPLEAPTPPPVEPAEPSPEVAPSTAEPEPPPTAAGDEPHPSKSDSPPRATSRADWVLVGLGGALAVAGAALSWGLA